MEMRVQTFQQYQIRPIRTDGLVVAQFTDEGDDSKEGMEILVFEACEKEILD